MKKVSALSIFFVFALVLSAAADFSLVRTFGTPGGTTELTGLDNAYWNLFAVENLGPEGSCLYIIDPWNGEVLKDTCVTDEPPGCPGQPPQYLSCTFDPWGDNLLHPCTDAHMVGDACGDIIEYTWTDAHGLVPLGHCMPDGIEGPVGMAYYDGYVYYIDLGDLAIYRLEDCLGQPPDGYHLPDGLTSPSALTVRGGNFFVGASDMDVVYEINDEGQVVDIHELEGFNLLSGRALTGMTFIGELLFVASNDDEIFVYEFAAADGFDVEVPEGDSVCVGPVPEGLGICFPTVSDSGSLYVHVSDIDPCSPPGGVRFLPDFYEIMTTASFEYAAQIMIMTSEPLPAGVNANRVRIFARPSGDCMPWMDITVAPLEFVDTNGLEMFRVRTRTLSEDDQFSVFILGVDRRNPMDVISMKFMYLEEAIEAVGGAPVDPYQQMMELLEEAQTAFGMRGYRRAARLVDRIAEIALATPEIPHTYTPQMPDGNIAGRIVARAHTLSFSLRQLVREVAFDGAGPLLAAARPSAPEISVVPNPSSSGFTVMLSAHEGRAA
jgi:hypothetical protein